MISRGVVTAALIVAALLFCSTTSATIVLEDVDVLIIGRCRSAYDFIGLKIGWLPYCGIGIENTKYEKVNLYTTKGIYKNLDNHIIFMRESNGFYFWNQFVPFNERTIPPFVVIFCYADELYLSER